VAERVRGCVGICVDVGQGFFMRCQQVAAAKIAKFQNFVISLFSKFMAMASTGDFACSMTCEA
jgi:hypothetical protein